MSKLIEDFIIEYKFIDDLHDEAKKFFFEEIDGKKYNVKPMMNHLWFRWDNRIKDAIRILRGKSIALHYKCDDYKNKK